MHCFRFLIAACWLTPHSLLATSYQPDIIDWLSIDSYLQSVQQPVSEGSVTTLDSPFQAMFAEIDEDGVRIVSKQGQGEVDSFRLFPVSILSGRNIALLPGKVTITQDAVLLDRGVLMERFLSTVDGIRQDFIIHERLQDEGALVLELAITGAAATDFNESVKLTLANGRELLYHKLYIYDAVGDEVKGHFEVVADNRVAIHVHDQHAVYPLTIDPTFSDANWVAMNPAFTEASERIYAILPTSAGELYVAGSFQSIGNVAANRIAHWNGSQWSALGSGLSGDVLALAIYEGDLIAAGRFLKSGNMDVGRIARWDGEQWSGLGRGVFGTVYALAVDSTGLYAGGDFLHANGRPEVGGTLVNRIARWDGVHWHALGKGIAAEFGYSNSVFVSSLAFQNNTLLVGGSFRSAGEVAAMNIARWNGDQWSALGDGLGNRVLALAVNNEQVFAGGWFSSSGERRISSIAVWDGKLWLPLGAGVTDIVTALHMNGNDLYVGGYFRRADGIEVNNIARWDGSDWYALEGGVDDWVGALAVDGSYLFVAGNFSNAGGVFSPSLARYRMAGPGLLRYDANGADAGSVPEAQTLEPGTALQIASNTGGLSKSGHRFVGWNTLADGSGEAFSPGASYTGQVSLYLYAEWQLNQYTLSFDSAGGNELDSITADFGSVVQLVSTPVREGASFMGWLPQIPRTMPAENMLFTAQWQLNQYSISVADVNHVLCDQAQAEFGSLVLCIATAPSGYRFAGWQDAHCVGQPRQCRFVVTDNVVLQPDFLPYESRRRSLPLWLFKESTAEKP